jgi:hypothetical protein
LFYFSTSPASSSPYYVPLFGRFSPFLGGFERRVVTPTNDDPQKEEETETEEEEQL